jgi:hypothetical protein
MEAHPFDIVGLVPSLSCTKAELLRAKRMANLTLERNGKRHRYHLGGVPYEYTASIVNDCADMLEKVIESGTLVFRLVEWGPYTSNWNPQAPRGWHRPIPGWESKWEACSQEIHRLQQDPVSWEVLKGDCKARELRQELERKIALLNEEAVTARELGENAQRGQRQAVADLTEERNRHKETAGKLQLLEGRQNELLRQLIADRNLLEKEREDVDSQLEQLETDRDLLLQGQQQLEKERHQLQQDKDAFALLQVDHDSLRREREAFVDLHRQLQTERDQERETFQRVRQELQASHDEDRAAFLQARDAILLLHHQLQAEISQLRDGRDPLGGLNGARPPPHSLECHSGLPAAQYEPNPNTEEISTILPTQTPPENRQVRNEEGRDTPSDPRSQAPTLPRPRCTKLGRSADGLAVWGGVNRQGQVYRRVRGSKTGSSSIKHSEVVYDKPLEGRRKKEVDDMIRDTCGAPETGL